LAHLETYGRFNVGWLTFRNDPVARACLQRWREQCLAWCFDRLEDGRFADQKYLDEWPERFGAVRVIQHKGANVGPWNVGRYELTQGDGSLKIGGDSLLFFHAHGFEPEAPGRPRELNLRKYGVEDTALLREYIFCPYEHALKDAIAAIAPALALALLADHGRDTAARLQALENTVTRLQEALTASEAERSAQLGVIDGLQQQLAVSETDRTSRLAVISKLQSLLDASEADRSARFVVIDGLQQQLQASEGDRAARLDAIEHLRAQLAASEGDRAARLDAIEHLRAQLAASDADRVAGLNVIQSLRDHLASAESQRLSLERDRGALQLELQRLHQQLDAIQASRLWRWTAPLRRRPFSHWPFASQS